MSLAWVFGYGCLVFPQDRSLQLSSMKNGDGNKGSLAQLS